MSLDDFVFTVNKLDLDLCANINRRGGAPFKAVHIPMPESMLKWYYDNNFTPMEAVTELNED